MSTTHDYARDDEDLEASLQRLADRDDDVGEVARTYLQSLREDAR